MAHIRRQPRAPCEKLLAKGPHRKISCGNATHGSEKSRRMQTLPQYIVAALAKPGPRAFAERLGAKDWRFTSSREMLDRASATACSLRFSGIERGDRVALIADNRVDWIAANFGIL